MLAIKPTTFLLILVVLFSARQQKIKESTKEYPKVLQDFIKNGNQSILPDFSYAGYAYGEKQVQTVEGPVFNVTDFGAIPNDGKDDSKAIQMTVDAAGKKGGGVVFFPVGRFDVNSDTTRNDIIRIWLDISLL